MILFTKHARQRMAQRNITTDDVINTLHNGIVRKEENGHKTVVWEIFQVSISVEDDTIVIVTVMPTNKHSKRANKFAKRNNTTVREALRLLNQKHRERIA